MEDSKLWEILSNVNLAALVAIIVLLCIAVRFLYPIFVKLKELIISNNENKQKQLSVYDNVEELKKNITIYKAEVETYKSQLTDLREEFNAGISDISRRLDTVIDTTNSQFNDLVEKSNKRVRAELKDKITQSYRYYHALGKWNTMEKEALEDLIEEYEAAGGLNSFVHSVVNVEKDTWDLIPLSDNKNN